MTAPSKITDHVDRALAQLLSWVRADEPTEELVSIFADSVQDAEDLVWECLVERYIETSVGVQLDTWAEVLGAERAGLGDTEFQRFLLAWQAALRSQGRRDEIIRALDAVADSSETWYHDIAAAWYMVTLLVTAPPVSSALEEAIARIAEASAPSGVAYQVIIGDDVTPFQFDTTGRGLDDGKLCARVV